jgi:hypothetical protein
MTIKSIITQETPALLIVAILFASCQKNLDSKSTAASKPNPKQAADIAGLQSLLTVDDVQQMILAVSPNSKESAQILAGSCPPVTTYNPAPNVYPRTVTVDWGTGCTNANGITRSGKIIWNYTDTLANAGAKLTTTYSNYTINGVKIEGKATIAHNDSTVDGDAVYRLKQINRKVTQPNGDFIIYNSSRRVIKFMPNDIHFPDESNTGWYRVTGTQNGDEMKGGISYQWTSTIDSPLIYKSCSFVTKGSMTVVFTNQSNWFIDFGRIYICDNLAELTQDSVTTTVTLPLNY